MSGSKPMQRAGLITLGLLGGGVTLGAVAMQDAHQRDCQRMRDAGIPDTSGACTTGSSFGSHGGGYHGSWGGTSYAEADAAPHGSVVRGGFGATGRALGGFHFGG